MTMKVQTDTTRASPTFGEAFRVWLKIGCINFGGPAGQIAMMHRMMVDEKKWIDEPRFLHALSFCMLLPGPEAQKLAADLGGPDRHDAPDDGRREKVDRRAAFPACAELLHAAAGSGSAKARDLYRLARSP